MVLHFAYRIIRAVNNLQQKLFQSLSENMSLNTAEWLVLFIFIHTPEILLNNVNVVLKAIERCWKSTYFKHLKPYDVLMCINYFTAIIISDLF